MSLGHLMTDEEQKAFSEGRLKNATSTIVPSYDGNFVRTGIVLDKGIGSIDIFKGSTFLFRLNLASSEGWSFVDIIADAKFT